MFVLFFWVVKPKCPLYLIGKLFKNRNILIGNVFYVQLLHLLLFTLRTSGLLSMVLTKMWTMNYGSYVTSVTIHIMSNVCPFFLLLENSFALLFAVINKHFLVIFSLVFASFGSIAMGRTPKHKPPRKEKCKSTPKHQWHQMEDDSDTDSGTEGKSGGRSCKSMCLNLWDEQSMIDALAEYNELCRVHGLEHVSMASVAKFRGISPATFWKRYTTD